MVVLTVYCGNGDDDCDFAVFEEDFFAFFWGEEGSDGIILLLKDTAIITFFATTEPDLFWQTKELRKEWR